MVGCPLNGNCVQHYAKMKKKPRKLRKWNKQVSRVGGEEAGGKEGGRRGDRDMDKDKDKDKDQSGGWRRVEHIGLVK